MAGTLWGNVQQVERYEVLTLTTQYAWRLTTDDIAPAVANTQTEQMADDETPAGWGRAQQSPDAVNEYAWRIERTQLSAARGWTVWGNVQQVEQYEVLTLATQYAWRLTTDDIAPNVVNTQTEQADNNATPAGWSRAQQLPDAVNEYAWRIERTQLSAARGWALWGNVQTGRAVRSTYSDDAVRVATDDRRHSSERRQHTD